MSGPLILVGARVLLYVNGVAFGRVFGFQWYSATGQRMVYGLDSSGPYEAVPTQAKAGGTVNVYRTTNDGGAQGAQLTTQFKDLVRQRYFTVALVDRVTGEVLFEANRCSLAGENWNVPVRSFVTGSLTFECLEWDNSVPSAPT
jgi:hypothetical protein